jgi:hypothetical protein
MKKRYQIFLMVIISIFLLEEAQMQTLSYSRITTGFNTPTFEGGRTDFAFSDINDNGHVDILSIGDHGNPLINSTQQGLLIWFNNGDGTFESFMTGYFGYGGIAVGDVNNDGLKDIGFGQHHNYASTGFGDQLIEVALGDGTGMNWTPWDVGLATNGETWGMFGTDFGDVNNNGLLDLVSIGFGSGPGFHVYLNQGDGTWVPGFGLLGNNSEFVIQFADLNNDGYLDFIAGHAIGTAYFGDGSGIFVQNDTGLPEQGFYTPRYGVSVGDVNNDGSSGLAFTNSNGGVEVYEFDNAGNSWISWSGNLPASGSFERTQLFDMNADGYTDVMAFGAQTFQLWLGDGTGNWIPDASFQTDLDPGSARAFRTGGDLNKNGYGDVVILSNEKTGFLTWQNRLYVYAENSIPDSLWIKGLYPKGNEIFFPGSVRFIQWASAVPGTLPTTVKIEISAFGANGPWWLVADNLPNNGKYQWTVPNYGSDEVYLRFTVTDGSQTASSVMVAPFIIIGEPTSTQKSELTVHAKVFPNPGNEALMISNVDRVERLLLISQNGKTVLDQPNPSMQTNVEMLPAGLYIYRLQMKTGEWFGGKWMKTDRK